MYSQGEDMGKDHMEEEGEINWVHGETQMLWTLTGKEKGIGCAIIVGSLATWPGIVGKEIKQE